MSTHIDTKIDDLVVSIAGLTGKKSDLSTTDKTTLVAAINENFNKLSALGTVEHEAATIAARDALTGLTLGDRVFVTDATADTSVDAGWAIYRYDGSGFLKLSEQESLDVTFSADLSLGAATINNREILITNGTSVIIPSATPTISGLMSGTDKAAHDEHVQEVATVAAANYANDLIALTT